MLNQHIVDRSRYGHHGLRSGGRPARPTNRIDGSYTGPGVPVTVSPDRPEPPNTRNQTHALSGWGEAPLGTPAAQSCPQRLAAQHQRQREPASSRTNTPRPTHDVVQNVTCETFE